jgi:hypothetical protein
MLPKHIAIAALIIAAPLHAAAGATPMARTPWQTLAALDGSWRLAVPRTDGERDFRISFRMISRGSALVETFGNPAKNVTETVYHRDGEKVMATHYCAQGNQPRLVLEGAPQGDGLTFRFLDITNLANPAASHLVRIDFRIIDRYQIERRETYSEKGVAEESMLRLIRAQ